MKVFVSSMSVRLLLDIRRADMLALSDQLHMEQLNSSKIHCSCMELTAHLRCAVKIPVSLAVNPSRPILYVALQEDVIVLLNIDSPCNPTFVSQTNSYAGNN